MRFRCFLLLFLISSVAVAQYTSRLGRFQVDERKGCAPFTVTITHLLPTECNPGNPCSPRWGDGSPDLPQNATTHTYNLPGVYTLAFNYQSALGGMDDITITVTPNVQPTFDLFTCNGNQVQVRLTDTNYDGYIINYNDASGDIPVGQGATNIHTYTPGPHTVSIRGKDFNAADNCTPPANKNIVALPALSAPFIDELTVAGADQVDLELTHNTQNTLNRLEIATNTINPGSFQLIQSLQDVPNTTVSNSAIRTDDHFYCFRMGVTDPCSANPALYSNIICTANFDATAQSNQNNLVWVTNFTGITNFSVVRNTIPIASPTNSPYIDPSICKTDSCYQIISNYANGSRSFSLEKCVTAFSNNPVTQINNVTAVVNGNSVDLTWQQNPPSIANEYNVFRNSDGGTYSLLAKSSATQFRDDTYSTGGEYCYQINYKDVCDNNSPAGIEVCPIRLSGELDSDNSIKLDWSDYTGWTAGVSSYTLDKYDHLGAHLQTINNISITEYEDNVFDPANQQFTYIVTAHPVDVGLGQSVSNEVSLAKRIIIKYPTAFTPNGDNVNDIYRPLVPSLHDYLMRFEMKIFNRWGELLFTTEDIEQGWNGKYKGSDQPEGTYVYVTTITDLAGQTFKQTGSIILLRRK